MLTKDDLIAIGEILDQRVEKQLSPLKKDVKGMKSDLTKIQKDVRVMLAVLDREDMELRRRVEKIEKHLGLSEHN